MRELHERITAVARENPDLSRKALAQRFGVSPSLVGWVLAQNGVAPVRKLVNDCPTRNNYAKAAIERVKDA